MASSNIKLFDENKGNMLSDSEFSISNQRMNGLQTGVASSQLQNKAMYQASLIAYAIAQVMMQNGKNANDTDAVSAFVANLSGTMLQKVYDIATTAEAQAGVATGKWMSPALVKAAIDTLAAKASNILSDTTKAMYGLGTDAVPDDAFALLGKYNLHWWRRRTATRVYRYDKVVTPQIQTTVSELASSVPSATLVVNRDANTGSNAVYRTFYHATSIEIDQSTGEVKLVNPESSSFRVGYSNGFSATEGTYFTNVYENPTAVYKGANTASNGTQKVGGFYYQYLKSGVEVITSEKVFDHYTDLGDWEYVTSISKETYPKNGYLDGYVYEYIGIPLDNAVSSARIEIGSYVGTGSYGAKNKNEILFDRIPVIVIVSSINENKNYSFTWIEGVEASATVTSKQVYSRESNKFIWYSTNDAKSQLNVADAKYFYVAVTV